MIKDMEISVVPKMMIKSALAMGDIIILVVITGTMHMDKDIQTIVVNRALMTWYLEEVAITNHPKVLRKPVLKDDIETWSPLI